MVLRDLNSAFSGARGRLFTGALTVPLAMSAWLSTQTPANAEEPTPAAAAHVWDEELRQLHEASIAAREYAMENYGVGIVLHVGRDISGRPDAEAALAQVSTYYINEFAKREVEARVFPSLNPDTVASGVTYHIDEIMYGAHNGTEIKDLRQGLEAIPDVIAHLKIAKQVADLDGNQPQALPGG
ncbi:MAG: hypothetical protein AAF683_01390 [Pseudomonadota bacterium]